MQALNAELDEVEFELLRWEDNVYRATSTFQDQILSPADADLVFCLFWTRLGTPLPPTYDRDDGTSRSGTEFEFELAVGAAEADPDSGPDVFVYRKTAAPADSSEEIRGELRALDSFWRRWFRDEEGHFLAAFDTFETTDEFAARLDRHVRRWLEEKARAAWDVTLWGSPFRGLEAFDEDHARVFFGRRREIDRARARLMASAERGSGALFLLGASGSGKSSLLRAGLIPRLLVPESTSPLVSRWRRLVVTPSALLPDAATALAHVLVADDVLPELAERTSADALARMLASEPDAAVSDIVDALDRAAEGIGRREGHDTPPRTGLILGLDQLEEIFRADSKAYKDIVSILVALARDRRIWLVASLRSDFYPQVLGDSRLRSLKESGASLDLAPLRPADMREMIQGAAGAAGLELEDDGTRSLLELLEREANQPGALPMIQFALQALFDARDRTRGVLRLETYDRLGGAGGALATEAERVLGDLGPAGEDAFPRVLRRLVDVQLEKGDKAPSASAAPLSAFEPGSPERRLADALVDARLLVTWGDPASGETYVRVAHESLFLHWPRAREQITRDRRDLETRTRLEQARRLWAEAEASESSGRLLRGLSLLEARDLARRWRGDLPPLLREFISASERAEKRRRRRRRATITAVIALLLALAVSASWFGVRADRARSEAESAQASAEEVIELQQRVLEDMEPDTLAAGMVERIRGAAGGLEREGEGDPELALEAFDALARRASPVDQMRELLIARVLEPAEARMDERLAGTPSVHAQLQRTLADIYRSWGEYERALELSQGAAATLRRELGEAEPATLAAIETAAQTRHDRSEYEEARALLEEVVEARRRLLGDEDPDTLASKRRLGEVLLEVGEHGEARALLEEALEGLQRVSGEGAPATLAAMTSLAEVRIGEGELEAAQEVLEEAARRARRELGDDDPQTLRALFSLAHAHFEQGNVERAREVMEEALERRRRVLGREHRLTLMTQGNLGVVLEQLGEHQRASALKEQTVAGMRRVLGDDHQANIVAMRNVGADRNRMGEYEEAISILERALELSRDARGPNHPSTFRILGNLASSLRGLGRYGKAVELNEEFLELSTEVLGRAHAGTLDARRALARTLRERGDYDEAREVLGGKLSIHRRELGERHPRVLRTLGELAIILKNQGEVGEARALLEEALSGLETAYDPRHFELTRLAWPYFELLRDAGDRERAEEIYDTYLRWLEPEDPEALTLLQREVRAQALAARR